MRLISHELCESYLEREVSVQGKVYRTIFNYHETPVRDTRGEALAHEVSIGFESAKGALCTTMLYLPIRLENGLLTKNKTDWYPVNMVLPPFKFYGPREKRVKHFTTCINPQRGASSLDDFFPLATSMGFTGTPFMRERTPREAEDINNLYAWNIIGLDLALLECFNLKIISDIQRSLKGGFNGISATKRAMHTLINAFCRHAREDAAHAAPDERFEVIPDELHCTGSLYRLDKEQVLVMHPLIKDVALDKTSPIDFCSSSQTAPIRTGRLKDGITIRKGRFEGRPTFPYTGWRRAIVGILADDPRRVIVARNITRAVKLDEPDPPLAVTEVDLDLDSLSLPGIRMTHPLNYEDGMIVSERFARKAGCYKRHVATFTVPAAHAVFMLKHPYHDNGHAFATAKAIGSGIETTEASQSNIVRGNEVLAYTTCKAAGSPQVREIRARVRTPSLVLSVDSFTPVTDLEEPLCTFRVVMLAYLPLEVGDKISDAHGNKATISAIYPDRKLPVWTADRGALSLQTHYIASPYIMKRLALGAEIEDTHALANFMKEKRGVSIEAEYSSEMRSLHDAHSRLEEEQVSYTGSVRMSDGTHTRIPLSMRRMFRLDNHVREICTVRHEVRMHDHRRVSRNTRLGLEIVTMHSRGATLLVRHLLEASHSKAYVLRAVLPLLHALYAILPDNAPRFPITRKLDRSLLGNPCSSEHLAGLDLHTTVCDPRIRDHYGIIQDGTTRILVPPHTAVQELDHGLVMVHRIAVMANRVLSELHSRDAGYRQTTDVPHQVARYRETLARLLTGKDGLIREAVYPVFPITIRSVAAPYLSDDPLKIALPLNVFRKLSRRSAAFNACYQDHRARFCLLKRDPVHREQNLITVRFTLWQHQAIGISPLLIRSLDGDFDGDTLTAMFPADPLACNDARKLLPDFAAIFSPSKQLVDATSENALQLLQERTGWSSTFGHPHESDRLMNQALFNRLKNGISMDELSAECIRAAEDFAIVKEGTARTGSLALAFIFSRDSADREALRRAMELYHLLAQNTLNAKSGIHTPALELVAAFDKHDPRSIKQALKHLGYTDESGINELLQFAALCHRHGGRMRLLTQAFPLFAATLRGANSRQVLSDSMKRLFSTVQDHRGILESLMSYLQ